MEKEKLADLKFKISTFIKYLIFEPWTNKLSFPNYRTINWVLLYFAIYFRYKVMIIILLITGVIFHLLSEWQSKKYIDWYRSRKYAKQKEALKKIREERKGEVTQTENK